MGKCVVLGAGNAACAAAAYLGLRGHQVTMYEMEKFASNLDGIREAGGLRAYGAAGEEGFTPVYKLTTDPAEACEEGDILFLNAPAYAHIMMAEIFAPHLKDGQIVVLNPGNTFGALEFLNTLRACGNDKAVIVGECASNTFATRRTGPSEVNIMYTKHMLQYNCIPCDKCEESLKKLQEFFPMWVAGRSPFEASIGNNNMILHPAPTILNTGWCEDSKGNFDFYGHGMTPSVSKVQLALDEERMAIGRALGWEDPIRTVDSLHEYYGLEHLETLHDFTSGSPVHTGERSAPHDMHYRYVTEDVPFGFVPCSEVARALGVPTPVMDAFISIASAMHDVDYRATGRNLKRLGLEGLTPEQIRHKLMYGTV